MPSTITARTPALAKLVEKQMRNWELARQQQRTSRQPAQTAVQDFVCVSRQIGTDGRGIAEGLGDRLGWPVFDREILDTMAGDDIMRRQIYESMDQRDLSWWEETLRSLMQSEFVRNDYFKKLSETILVLARQGRCVFLGRGADLLLPGDLGFRVRLVAERSERVARLARRHQVTEREAGQWIERVERDRQRYFQRHFGIDVGDPVRFDLTVNLSRFEPRAAIDLILHARAIRAPKA